MCVKPSFRRHFGSSSVPPIRSFPALFAMTSSTNPLENARPTALRIGASSGSRISWGRTTAFVPDPDVGDEKPRALTAGAIDFKNKENERAVQKALEKKWAALKRSVGEECDDEKLRKYWTTIDEQLKEATAKWDKAEETKTVKVEAETAEAKKAEAEKAQTEEPPKKKNKKNKGPEPKEPEEQKVEEPTPTPTSASSSGAITDKPKAPKAPVPGTCHRTDCV